jgi:RNA ligase (TIGR02306 family)
MRKLVTLETVLDVRPIPEADAIEAIVIRGWTVVAKKGEFNIGDTCAYFEIDCALPMSDERFTFLASRGTRITINGINVHVLRTAKLRGVYSQGLAIPVAQFPELVGLASDTDVAELLGITKWEPPIPATLAGDIEGAFPTDLARKTDAERIQNLVNEYPRLRSLAWVATEKIDGTSATFIKSDGRLRVCGRNWELRDGPNTYWDIARRLELAERLADGDVIQGEIYGEGIQSNPLMVRGQHLAAFTYAKERQPVPHADWPSWLAKMAAPIVSFVLPATVEEAVAAVDGWKSVITPGRKAEGLVFHSADGAEFAELGQRGCFKIISNAYLLKLKSD